MWMDSTRLLRRVTGPKVGLKPLERRVWVSAVAAKVIPNGETLGKAQDPVRTKQCMGGDAWLFP